MTTGIWLLWPRPPLAIAFIKEHECALKETSGTQMVNISKKKKTFQHWPSLHMGWNHHCNCLA